MIVTAEYLNTHPECIFVFGDNLCRYGYGGAAALRDHMQAYGFITKKAPNNFDAAFYHPEEYVPVFNAELKKLQKVVENNPSYTFLISKLGSGLANKYRIWEEVIRPLMQDFINTHSNVRWV